MHQSRMEIRSERHVVHAYVGSEYVGSVDHEGFHPARGTEAELEDAEIKVLKAAYEKRTK